jgi:signal transduction histidine kinase
VTLGVVVPLVVILGGFTYAEYARHRSTVLTNLAMLASQSGQVINDNLRHEMLEEDIEGIQGILDSIGAAEAFRVIYVLDTEGEVVLSPGGEGVGRRLDNNSTDCQPCHRLAPEGRPSSVVVENEEGQTVFRSMHPIENSPECAECHESDERLLGVLLTDIPTAPLEAPLTSSLRENLLWWLGTIVVTVIVVNLAISRLVLGRLRELVEAMTGFARGQLPLSQEEPEPDEIGQLAGAFNDMAQKVEARRQENQQLSQRLHRQSAQRGELLKSLITAQEDERKRIARELHDEMGQALGGLALRTELIERYVLEDNPRALEHLGRVSEMITETTDKMYDLILALRPSSLDDLGLVPALWSQAERALENTGIRFELDSQGLKQRLPAAVETAVFRSFQEAITNIVRHSGASQVRISLACDNGDLKGSIVDDGHGFDASGLSFNGEGRRGLGLLGMQERVTQCGGRLDIDSQPGRGTEIRMRIPLGDRREQ